MEVFQKERRIGAMGLHAEPVGDAIQVLEETDDMDGLDHLLPGPPTGQQAVPVRPGDCGRLTAELRCEVEQRPDLGLDVGVLGVFSHLEDETLGGTLLTEKLSVLRRSILAGVPAGDERREHLLVDARQFGLSEMSLLQD